MGDVLIAKVPTDQARLGTAAAQTEHGTTVATSWRSLLPVHQAANRILAPTDEEKRGLAADLKQRGQQVPVVVVRVVGSDAGPQLVDGVTRLDLQEAAGIQVVDADGQLLVPHRIVEVESDAEAEALSLSLNVHRRHLSGEARRKLIAEVLKAQPKKSNRQIAKTTQVDDKTVGAVRADLEARAEIPHVETTIDTQGRRQPARKPAKPHKRGRVSGRDVGQHGGDDGGASEAERLRARCGELEDILQREKTRSLGLESEVTDLREAAAKAQRSAGLFAAWNDGTDAELAAGLAAIGLEAILRVMPAWRTKLFVQRATDRPQDPANRSRPTIAAKGS